MVRFSDQITIRKYFITNIFLLYSDMSGDVLDIQEMTAVPRQSVQVMA